MARHSSSGVLTKVAVGAVVVVGVAYAANYVWLLLAPLIPLLLSSAGIIAGLLGLLWLLARRSH